MLIGFAAALLLFVASIYLVTLPDGTRSLTARAHGGNWIDLSFTPGETEVRFGLRLEGFSDHRAAEIKASSSEQWAPTWDARLEGRVGEFVSFSGYGAAPEPVTMEMAERIARSYRVALVLDGEEQTIDFAEAQVTEPLVLPTIEVLRFRFGR